MNALSHRVVATLSKTLQALIAAHRYDDLDELVQQVALARLEAEAGDSDDAIFSRARSAVRRQTQDVAHWSVGHLDGFDIATDDVIAARTARRGSERADLVREVAQLRKVTRRRAQQLVKTQLERVVQGDLFAVGGAI